MNIASSLHLPDPSLLTVITASLLMVAACLAGRTGALDKPVAWTLAVLAAGLPILALIHAVFGT